jgi:Spy/CpxP family protein refolding chaperone
MTHRALSVHAAMVLSALIALGAAAPASAHGRARDGGPRMLPLIVRTAGLSDVQRAQVREIVAAHRPQVRQISGQLRAAHEALRAKLSGTDAVTEADLAPLVQQISQLREQLTQERLRVALEIRSLLTPEQLARVAQARARLEELRREMRGLVGGR